MLSISVPLLLHILVGNVTAWVKLKVFIIDSSFASLSCLQESLCLGHHKLPERDLTDIEGSVFFLIVLRNS